MRSGSDLLSTGIRRPGQSRGIPVETLCFSANLLAGVRRQDLQPGDLVEVRTRNSRYVVRVLGDGSFLVSGGWFRKIGLAGSAMAINGCTWGGRAIKTDWIAAPGLFLEFANGVRTTRIQEVHWRRASAPPA